MCVKLLSNSIIYIYFLIVSVTQGGGGGGASSVAPWRGKDGMGLNSGTCSIYFLMVC